MGQASAKFENEILPSVDSWAAILKHYKHSLQSEEASGTVELKDGFLSWAYPEKEKKDGFKIKLASIKQVEMANCVKITGGKFVWGPLVIVELCDQDEEDIIFAVKRNEECSAAIRQAITMD